MKYFIFAFILLTICVSSFCQDYPVSKYVIGNFFLSSPKIEVSINHSEEFLKGKSAYIYFNNSYVVVYLEDAKKTPLVYKVRFSNESFDSASQTLQISYVHFDNLVNEEEYFKPFKYGYIYRAPPEETFVFTIPYGKNKSKYECLISYNTTNEHGEIHDPYVQFEGKKRDDRNAEMEKIIESAVAKEKIINKNRLKVGDEYKGGIIIHTDKNGVHGIICTKTNIADSISCNEAINFANTFKLSNRKWRLPTFIEADYISHLKIAQVGLFKDFVFSNIIWISDNGGVGMATSMGDKNTSAIDMFFGKDYKGNIGVILVSNF